MLKTAGALVAVVVGCLTIWGGFGFPSLATMDDVERLEEKQLDTAVGVYEDQLDRYVIRRGQLQSQGLQNTPEQQAIERQIDRLENKLDTARDRQIELSK